MRFVCFPTEGLRVLWVPATHGARSNLVTSQDPAGGSGEALGEIRPHPRDAWSLCRLIPLQSRAQCLGQPGVSLVPVPPRPTAAPRAPPTRARGADTQEPGGELRRAVPQ